MKVRTFSVVCGTQACNGKCPFCVARMTPMQGIAKSQSIDYRNLLVACRVAQKAETLTALITGKGEPTLYPEMVSKYTYVLFRFFPLVELQTNGLLLNTTKLDPYLKLWHKLGLSTISLSVVHYEDKLNSQIYTAGKYTYNLTGIIRKLRAVGFSVRLSVICLNDYIDNAMSIFRMIKYALVNKVSQLTLRPMVLAQSTTDDGIRKWTEDHAIPEDKWRSIVHTIVDTGKGVLLRKLIHGGEVYDIHGQNVCFTNCLTIDPDMEELRQLIYFPDGSITHDWNYKGARLL